MKERKKRSPIWFIPKQELICIVNSSDTFAKILSYFNLTNKGGNIVTLKKRCQFDEIDLSHIKLGINSNQGRKFISRCKKLEELLIKDSDSNRRNIKRRLIAEGVLENKCEECGSLPEWKGKPLVMVLDHKNGDARDYRRENLRLICPNCNSQTPTFAGRNAHKTKKIFRCRCGKEVNFGFNICIKCAAKKRRKVERPDIEVLKKQIGELGFVGTGRLYGVSDNAIRKWIKII